jgi:TrpR-related protein YerC/YecD
MTANGCDTVVYYYVVTHYKEDMKKLYLDKVKRLDKLTKKDREELLTDLVSAIVGARSIGDAALFLQDLLTKAEIKMLSKRLRVAKLLLAGMTYKEIEKQLYVSHSTVAKIGIWLSERGDGFRKVVERLPKERQGKTLENSEWDTIKRRYSLYFWPELLLEEIIKSANNRQKQRIKDVLDSLEKKSRLHKSLEKLIRF